MNLSLIFNAWWIDLLAGLLGKRTNGPGMTLVAVWIPNELVRAMDAAAKRDDLDRSKLLRKALRETLRQP